MNFDDTIILLLFVSCGTFIGALKLAALPSIEPYRNIVACLVALIIGICSGLVASMSYYGILLVPISVITAILVANICSRGEIILSFVSVTIATLTLSEILLGWFFHAAQYQNADSGYKQERNSLLMQLWVFSLGSSLIGSVPVYFWHRWLNREDGSAANSAHDNTSYFS